MSPLQTELKDYYDRKVPPITIEQVLHHGRSERRSRLWPVLAVTAVAAVLIGVALVSRSANEPRQLDSAGPARTAATVSTAPMTQTSAGELPSSSFQQRIGQGDELQRLNQVFGERFGGSEIARREDGSEFLRVGVLDLDSNADLEKGLVATPQLRGLLELVPVAHSAQQIDAAVDRVTEQLKVYGGLFSCGREGPVADQSVVVRTPVELSGAVQASVRQDASPIAVTFIADAITPTL